MQFYVWIIWYAKFLLPIHSQLSDNTSSLKPHVKWKRERKSRMEHLIRNPFEESKKLLADALLLAHPQTCAQLAICTNSSNFSIGNNWTTVVGNHYHIFQDNYSLLKLYRDSSYDWESLAKYTSIRHFKHIVERRGFTLFTDHKPLTFAFKQKPEKCSPRQLHHIDFIGQFTTDIELTARKDNALHVHNACTDALYWIEINISCQPIGRYADTTRRSARRWGTTNTVDQEKFKYFWRIHF